MNKTCKDCDNFIGCGDWNLCCKNPPEEQVGWCGFLCYTDTPICKNYTPLRHIRLRRYTPADWTERAWPLHTGDHSQ